MTKLMTGPKNTVPVTAPSGGVVSGGFYLIENVLVHAVVDAAAGEIFSANIAGGHRGCPADNATAFGELETLYWNDTDGKLFNAADGGTGTGHPAVGICIGGKLASADECEIKLLPLAAG